MSDKDAVTSLALSPEAEKQWLQLESLSRAQWGLQSEQIFRERIGEINLWRHNVSVANRTNNITAICMVVMAVSVVSLCALIAWRLHS
jgi:hypothetical protein